MLHTLRLLLDLDLLRLVFTSDGVGIGVGVRVGVKVGVGVGVGDVIRSVKRYDLVKIKPTESEAEH